ncbi:MAG: hypothetical protein ACLRLD_06245 [Lachnospira sp.]|jgi:hypothetical protein
MKSKEKLSLNLQFFAEEPGNEEAGTNAGQQTQNSVQAFDYEKLASIINGKQTVAEDTVLKNYFKQQGLSKEEAEKAISAFKAEKAKNTPDVTALQTQLTQAQEAAKQANIDKAATLVALTLGIEAKIIPYVLKLADMSNVTNDDGSVNDENLKKALNKVLEDVPQLKTSSEQNNGFHIGNHNNADNQKNQQEQLEAIFGIKK